MKKILSLAVLLVAFQFTFAGDFDGKYTSGASVVTLSQNEAAVTGTLEHNGVTYELSGKVDANGVAHLDVLDNTSFLVSNCEVTDSGSQVVMQFTHHKSVGLPNSFQLSAK